MEAKSKYLIWHENGGLFTAVHKHTGEINTWSTVTGKMIEKLRNTAKEMNSRTAKPNGLDDELRSELIKDGGLFYIYQKDGDNVVKRDTTYVEGD